jgi:hypothetical protein
MYQISKVISLGIIHKLQQMKNPVTNILLSAELASTENDEEKRIAYFEVIKKNALKFDTDILEILAFFKDLESDSNEEQKMLKENKWDKK